jgi:serine/threonine protein kinase
MCRVTKEVSATKFDASAAFLSMECPTAGFKNLSLSVPKAIETPCTPEAPMKHKVMHFSENAVDINSESEPSAKQPEKKYHYKIGSVIREGCYGEIRYATRVGETGADKADVAIKVFDLKRIKKFTKNLPNPTADSPLREIEIQQLFSPEETHIVPILDTLESDSSVCIVLPLYTGGDLLDVVENSPFGRLPIAQVKEMFHQVLQGMDRLHSVYGVAHRDLSIENVFFQKEDETYAVGDFGLSFQVPKDPVSNKFLPTLWKNSVNISGKEGYIAPELWEIAHYEEKGRQETIDLFAIDVWALGIILFMALTGAAPMKRAVESDSYYQLLCKEKRIHDLVGDVKTFLTDEKESEEQMQKEEKDVMSALEMIQWILTPDPKLRPNVQDLLQHEWFSSLKDE